MTEPTSYIAGPTIVLMKYVQDDEMLVPRKLSVFDGLAKDLDLIAGSVMSPFSARLRFVSLIMNMTFFLLCCFFFWLAVTSSEYVRSTYYQK